MNFDNQLKPSFDDAKERFRFDLAKGLPDDVKGLYPDQLQVPVKASHLNNLYVKPEYRNLHIGRELMEKGMDWLRSVPDSKYIFVHVSNGNDAGSFYEKYAFHYSHDVFDGMIDAYWQEV